MIESTASPYAPSALFDFSAHKPERETMLPLIRQFAAHDDFRSAVVDELELDDDYYRRPLRPEDLDFLKFQKAVSADSVSRLPALATNRLLLCINELGIARLPKDGTPAALQRYEAFYGDRNQVLAQRIRPFLENYAFDYLGAQGLPHVAGGSDLAAMETARLRTLLEAERTHWDALFAMLMRNDYLMAGLKFILVQRWSLAASRQSALSKAAGAGYFDAVAASDVPDIGGGAGDAALLRAAAAACEVERQTHSYWQFYLPTSLAKANLLYALGSRPDRAWALLGAAYAAEAESIAFSAALLAACPHLGRLAGAALGDETLRQAALLERHARALAALRANHGAAAAARVSQGLGAGIKLAERARWDMGEQLRWLSAIPRYVAWAREIDLRIGRECPGIDRETFVEPREMCSTTHVHSDHRLVVVESGDMVFWGNLGMRLEMRAGDMVLIPDGRLHGSTVVSAECTYHQPIIPDAWIADLLAETAIRPGAALMA